MGRGDAVVGSICQGQRPRYLAGLHDRNLAVGHQQVDGAIYGQGQGVFHLLDARGVFYPVVGRFAIPARDVL